MYTERRDLKVYYYIHENVRFGVSDRGQGMEEKVDRKVFECTPEA